MLNPADVLYGEDDYYQFSNLGGKCSGLALAAEDGKLALND